MKPKTRVLWVSRHDLLPAEEEFLKARLGNIEIIQYTDKVPSAEWLYENVIKKLQIRYVLPVLPLSMVARLVELGKREGFTVLWSVMELLHNDYSEDCPEYEPAMDAMVPGRDAEGRKMWRHYRFKEIKKIEALELRLSPL